MPEQYDVAISLRWTDVEHVRALYDLLCDRLEVFFADEGQEEFVGTDGEESFGYIFRDRARLVVIFYRSDWGKTMYTRAEEAAIKQRAARDGYGFTIWVPMDDDRKVPPYLPMQQIWFDFGEYGVSGLAAVVEERVRALGAAPRPPSPRDELLRLRRAREADRRRQAFIGSERGAEHFVGEVNRILTLINTEAEALLVLDSDLHLKVNPHRTGRGAEVLAFPYIAELTYLQRYSNVAEGSVLTWKIKRRDNDRAPYPLLTPLKSVEYEVDLDPSGVPAWRTGISTYLSIEEIVETVMTELALMVAEAMTQR